MNKRMTNKQLQARYETMLNTIEAGRKMGNFDFYEKQGRINVYVCRDGCKHIVKTEDVDDGVTPFMLQCPQCKKSMYSSFYNDIHPILPVSFVWYRPELKDVLLMHRKGKDSTVNHILLGGLIKKQKNEKEKN